MRSDNAMNEPATLPKGTQPEGAKTQQDASRQVREMFTRIAPRYDFLNHLLSGQMDRLSASGKESARFLEADALRLPFPRSSFDLVTTAFGFRNLANYEDGLKEIFRILKSGGTLGILEFADPAPGFWGDAYRFYCGTVLPKIGGWISGDAEAYSYLPKSVGRFFRPPELAARLTKVGYIQVRYHLMTLGSVALHLAVRP
jgi:demethylmenaquinone methyltransferase / 2-methoxy-6-polyprenyl-1,4-benzoquinol methylase